MVSTYCFLVLESLVGILSVVWRVDKTVNDGRKKVVVARELSMMSNCEVCGALACRATTLSLGAISPRDQE